jgi:hypothetical protein
MCCKFFFGRALPQGYLDKSQTSREEKQFSLVDEGVALLKPGNLLLPYAANHLFFFDPLKEMVDVR